LSNEYRNKKFPDTKLEEYDARRIKEKRDKEVHVSVKHEDKAFTCLDAMPKVAVSGETRLSFRDKKRLQHCYVYTQFCRPFQPIHTKKKIYDASLSS